MTKMLITEALDERDFLATKIRKDIGALKTVTVRRKGDPAVDGGVKPEDFKSDNAALYQSIVDRIDRLGKINRAIIQSNAETKITVNGIEYTIAQAIATKANILKGDDLSLLLRDRLTSDAGGATIAFDRFNRAATDARDNYIKALLTGDNKELSDAQVSSIDTVVDPITPEIVEAIDVEKELDKLNTKLDELSAKLNTAIKVSNATTYIEF